MGDLRATLDYENLYYNNVLPHGKIGVTDDFLHKTTDIVVKHLAKSNDRNEKVVNFTYPEELEKQFDEKFNIEEDPLSLKKILDDCQTIVDLSVKTAHPRMWNQLFSGVDVVSLAGEMVTAGCNTSMYTHEMSPAFNLIEKLTLQKMGKMCGWTEPCDGLFNPGGSISNLYALQSALHHFYPKTKSTGLFNMPRLTVFTSKHSHYSVARAVAILGLGIDSLRKVPVDERGKMIPEKLEEMIKASKDANEIPFFVTCTAGTTVLGAFDPIEPVLEITKRHNMWLHLDAAWGGGALLSKKHRTLMKGIEHVDSVTWNPHKLMGSIQQCSVFLIKKQGILASCNKMSASYLFQQDKLYDVKYDTGDKTIQCGRHVDAFKCWLMWRSKGDKGFELQINKLWDLAALLYREVLRREDFEIVLENPECTNVCFWYIPKSIQHMDRKSPEFKEKLHAVAPKIKARMMLNGSMMCSYQPLDDKCNFFRMVFCTQATREEDVLFLMDEIETLGKDL